jgi:cation diffusion facilitator family transporter
LSACKDDQRCDLSDAADLMHNAVALFRSLKPDQRRMLLWVLAINALMFLIEFTAGYIANSSALMADAVDMLGDAIVYVLSLFALHRGARWEAGAAVAKGLIILCFFCVILGEIIFKIRVGVPPSSALMLIFGCLALLANLTCLVLLWRFRNTNINMSSTFECSRNDVLANVGVLCAGFGVAIFHSGWPDIAIGSVIALIFLRSAISVLKKAWPQFRHRAA